jgi:hypothetical protein
VFTDRDVAKVQNNIAAVVNPTKRIKDLEQKVTFSDTFQNRVNLADAYLESGSIETALEQYQIAMKDESHKNDFYANSQMITGFYELEQHEDVIATVDFIKNHPDFEKSKPQFLYGLSLYKLKGFETAKPILEKINRRYSNYGERLQLVKFFVENDRRDDAMTLLESLAEEGENLTKPNKRLHAKTFTEISKLQKELHA